MNQTNTPLEERDFTFPLWAKNLATVICQDIDNFFLRQEYISLMLTGGRSAPLLYRALHAYIDPELWRRIHIFFGDERSVEPSSDENIANVSLSQLFPGGVPSYLNVHRIEIGERSLNEAAIDYSRRLPESIDILLLSVGDDGHIASLFPGSPVLYNFQCKVMPVRAPKAPHSRVTITPVVIQSAKRIYVLAIGEEKVRIYHEAHMVAEDYISMPARLVLGGTWVFENSDSGELCQKF